MLYKDQNVHNNEHGVIFSSPKTKLKLQLQNKGRYFQHTLSSDSRLAHRGGAFIFLSKLIFFL